MIAHIGIIVRDIEKSKNFYAAALNPIGYQMIRDYGVTPTRRRRARDLANRRAPICGSIRAILGRSPRTSPFK